jgi:hypothetical protein
MRSQHLSTSARNPLSNLGRVKAQECARPERARRGLKADCRAGASIDIFLSDPDFLWICRIRIESGIVRHRPLTLTLQHFHNLVTARRACVLIKSRV